MATVRIQVRRGTAADWTSVNPTLAAGELGIETNTRKLKVGDGSTAWNSLSYIAADAPEISEISQDAINNALTMGSGLTKSYNDGANTITISVDSDIIALKSYVDSEISATETYADNAASAAQSAAASALSSHESDTTNIHGIADTSALATKTYADNAASTAQSAAATDAQNKVNTHNSNSTNVHGIADTAALATKLYADAAADNAQFDAEAYATSEVNAHNGRTTNVHGIADTAALATQTYVDNAVAGLGNTSDETYVPLTYISAQNGVASLNSSGHVPLSEISITTDSVSEGSNNLYFTDRRAQSAVGESTIVGPNLSKNYNLGVMTITLDDSVNLDGVLSADDIQSNSATIDGTLSVANINVSGNLTVSGTTTTVDTTNLSVTDPMIYMGSDNHSAILDLGIVAAYDDGTYQHAGLVKDATDGVWKLFRGVTDEPTTTVNFAQASYETLKLGNLQADSAAIGNVSNQELQYLNGATSNIQDQLDDKSPTDSPTFTGIVTLPSDSIIESFIADASVSTDKIQNIAITTAKINNLAVTTEKINDGAVNMDKLSTKSVSTDKLDDEAVTAVKLANDAVTVSKILDLNVSTAKISNRAITTDKIDDAAVTNAKLSNASVKNANIDDLAVSTEKIANKAITSAKLNDQAVTNVQIADDAVRTVHIYDGAISTAKLADSSVTTIKINDAAVTSDKIENGSITAEKIATGSVDSGKLTSDSVTTVKIADNAVTNAKLAGSIDQSKVTDLVSDLAAKAPLAGPTFTGTVVLPSTTSIGTVSATEIGYVDGVTSAIQTQLDSKLASSTAASTYAPIASPTFTGTVSGVTKSMVGLGNVDNTSDANKPISTATQTALDAKAPIASPTFTGTVSGITKSMVGLGNVDNTSDANKPVSTAAQTALDAKAPIASPTFTGTVSGITKSMVGLANVDNTSDANKPVSTATQTALDAKLALSGGTMTGALTLSGAPTSDLHAATKLYVDAAVNNINIHEAVVAATTANITLATAVDNGKTLDGVTLATGNRILVKNQTTSSQNGIYVVAASGAPTRASDYDTVGEISSGDFIFVESGTVNGNTGWIQTYHVNTLGTDPITFTQFSGAGTYTASTGLSLTGTSFAIDSTVATLTGTQTLTNKTINGSSNTITNVSLTSGVTGTLPVANGGTGLTSLGSGIQTFWATPSSANFAAALTDETGTGSVVFSNSPTLVTPVLGVATATSVNGTTIPSSKTLVVTTDKLSALAATTSAELAGVISDETGTGALVFANSPTLVSPTLGAASATSIAFSDGTQSKEGVPSRTAITQVTGAYDLSTGGLALRDGLIEGNSASGFTISIPTDATTNYPVGTSIDILQTGAGQITIAATTPATTTVNATPGLKLRTQWSSATLFKRAANTWVVMGDLTA